MNFSVKSLFLLSADAILPAMIWFFLAGLFWLLLQCPQVQAEAAAVNRTPIIETIVIEGNTRFSDDELEPIIEPYRGRALAAKDIHQLKNALTLYYVNRGYINSGALVPRQDLATGILRLQVVEGRLLAIDIEGNKRLRTGYIQRRVQPGLTEISNKANAPILNVNRLQQRLKLLEQDPRIERLHATLKPGIRLGEAELALTVEEARPYYLTLGLDNHLSPNVGDWQGSLGIGHLNLLGFGDSLSFDYRRAEGWRSYRGEYAIPIGSRGAVLAVSANNSESEVVAMPFDQLEITSQSESYGLHLHYSAYRTLTTAVTLGVGFEQRRSGSFLLGNPFAFSDGGPDGRSRLKVLSFSHQLVHRRIDRVLAAQSRFDISLDRQQDTEDSTPDGEFTAWLGQAQWLRQFNPDDDHLLPRSQLLWRLLLRWTNEPMLSSEQFPIGGNATVRGYRENQLTRDKGIVTSLEWRIGIGHWLLPGAESDADHLQLAPFIDYGKGINTNRGTPNPRDLTSVGMGIRWSVNRHLSAQLYWAEALTTVTTGTEHSLQDDGLHARVRLHLN